MFHLHLKKKIKKVCGKQTDARTSPVLEGRIPSPGEAWRGCPEEVSGGTRRGFDWSWDEGGEGAKDSRLCSCFSLIGLGRAQREWRAAAEPRQQAGLDKRGRKKKTAPGVEASQSNTRWGRLYIIYSSTPI